MSRGILRFALAFATVSFALPAAAHISLERGGTHKSRYGDGNEAIKTAPCGKANGARGTNVYTYEPGQTITVKFLEYVSHPGYYRFAFDNDGDNDFVTPKTIKPYSKNRRCLGAPDQCGEWDLYNSPTVLPNMDQLDPHEAGDPEMFTYQVKLPDVECANCTLQVIQVMEDNAYHGPYTPGPGFPGDTLYIPDVYYQCIDIVLKRGAGPGSGGATGAGGAASTGGAVGSGGTIGSGGMPGVGGLLPTGGVGGMTTGSGGSLGLGGTMTGTGGMTTQPVMGGMPTANGGLPGATGGALVGTGAAPAEAEGDEEGGCTVTGERKPSAGWPAIASALALAWTARRRSRRAA